MERGGKRGVEVAHRRWGKDDVCLHWSAVAQSQQPGTYWHMLPEAAQARKAVWDAINPHTGKRRIDEAFPLEIRESTKDQEMFIRTKFNTTWQVVGSDNFNSLVGSPPVGVVFSEWAIARPEAWAYLRPILAENGGWALFIYTPRGNNHGKSTYDMSVESPEWFSEISTAHDTTVFTPEQLENERREMVKQYGASRGEALFRQEYLCSFDEAFTGKIVYPEFDRKMHVAAAPLLQGIREEIENTSNRTVIRGWDNTGLHPACVFIYLHPMGRVSVFNEVWEEEIGIEDFADIVQQWSAANLPRVTKFRDIGDPAGKNRGATKISPAQYIKQKIGITIEDGIQTFKIRREAVANRLSRNVMGQPAFEIDPTQCPILLSGFMGGYGYKEIGNSGIYHDEPLKDKHADCFVAGTKISTPKGEKNIEDIIPGEYVLTPFGERQVIKSWCADRAADVIELVFSNGSRVTCTPDHKFYIHKKGLISADALQYNMILDSVNIERRLLWKIKRWLFLKEENIGFLEAITKRIDGQTIMVHPLSMLQYGKAIINNVFRRIIASITSITTGKTIPLPTFALSTNQNMLGITQKRNWPKIQKKPSGGLMPLKMQQKNGIDQTRAINGMCCMELKCGPRHQQEQHGVNSAEKNIRHDATDQPGSALQVVRIKPGDSGALTMLKGFVSYVSQSFKQINTVQRRLAPKLVQRRSLIEPRPVYSLWVEDDHVYYANGLLVKNCHDALQYPLTVLFPVSGVSQKKNIDLSVMYNPSSTLIGM
jgi:hypothetical protein